jgi:hypothetical protein
VAFIQTHVASCAAADVSSIFARQASLVGRRARSGSPESSTITSPSVEVSRGRESFAPPPTLNGRVK